MDIEECFADDYKREALVAETIIQNLIAGTYVDLSDVRNNFKHGHFTRIVCEYAAKYGILGGCTHTISRRDISYVKSK